MPFGKTIRRALFCTDSIASPKYFGRAAQTGQAYSSTDRTMLQYTCFDCMIVSNQTISQERIHQGII